MKEAKGYNSFIKNREVVVFGMGNNSKNCAEFLTACNIKFHYFTNSEVNYCSGSHLGVPLISSNKLDKNEYYVVISVDTESKFEISEFLQKKGYINVFDYITYSELLSPVVDFTYYNCKIGRRSFGFRSLGLAIKGNNIRSIGRYCSINDKAYAHRNHVQLIAQGISLYRLINSNVYKDNSIISRKQKLVIGNDVWIGANSFINTSSCHYIGDGAAIGAGAVVTHDVPPYAVVVGIPARVLKYRFPPEQIEILLRTKWWARKEEWLKENKMYLEDIDLFFKHFKNFTPTDDTLDEQIL